MNEEMRNALPIRCIVRGEWTTNYNTPGYRIPSHGTDMWGQRFGIDIHQADARYTGKDCLFLSRNPRSYNRGIVRVRDLYSWDAPVFSPFDGKVIVAKDGSEDRTLWIPLFDRIGNFLVKIPVFKSLIFNFGPKRKWMKRINRDNLQPAGGNYVIIEHEGIFALFGHMRKNSIRVREGDFVKEGQHIGNIGNSGNSEFPHVHFQLMDTPHPFDAKGIPFCFKEYEVASESGWTKVSNGIPKEFERLRYIEG